MSGLAGEKEREINVPSSRSREKLLRYVAARRRREENTSIPALKSGATVRPEILVILGARGPARKARPTLIPR